MIIHLTIFHSTNVASSNKCPTHTHTVAGGNDTSKVTVAGGNNTSTEPPTIAQAKSVSEEQQTSPPVNSNNNNNNTQTSPPVNSNNNNYTAINETTVNNNNDTSVGNNNNDTSSSPVLLCPVVGTPATPTAPLLLLYLLQPRQRKYLGGRRLLRMPSLLGHGRMGNRLDVKHVWELGRTGGR